MVQDTLSVGLVIDDNLDSTAGVQQFTLTIGRELSKRGHKVRYLTSETSDSHPDADKIYSLSKTVHARMNGNRVGTPLPASKSTIKNILQKENFDVIHVTTPYSPLLAGKVIVSTKAAVVGTFHIAVDTAVAGIGAFVLAALQWRSLRRFDYWTAVSLAAENFAKTYYRITPHEITPNPIELARFQQPKIPAALRSEKIVIVFLGRLVERKGAGYLLKAIASLPKDMQERIEVRIGGGGALRSKLEKFVEDQELQKTVSFYGFIEEDDKAAFLAAADICVFPSTGGECFGISLLEGMAVGSSAVIAGDNQGYQTILGNGMNVLIVPTDTDAFASRLADLIQNEDERNEIIAWQTEEVKKYDVSVVVDQIESVYRKAIAANTER